jgi:hypothetical protein
MRADDLAPRNDKRISADRGPVCGEADAAAPQALGAVTLPDQAPTYGQELERPSAAESVLRTRLGAADLEHQRAVGSALDLAASGRAAVTFTRGLLGSLQAVEPEEVVFDR